MRTKAKIAATVGPSCDTIKKLCCLMDAGMEIARLNFSHGTPESHASEMRKIRRAASKQGRHISVLADVQGPRFRLGKLADGRMELEAGAVVDLIAGKIRSAPGTIPVAYAALARDVKRGDRILIDDGKVEIIVRSVRGDRVRCEVVREGVVSDNKGLNLPGSDLSAPALTAKDKRDLRVAVAIEADWLAVSFVRKAADIKMAKRLLKRAGSTMPVMAKIERPEAIDNFEEILEEADGILVARGDLGVELPPQRVPILQKLIIDECNSAGKPVMTATQMLDSMRYSKQPTRAEASDVANAVIDGSSSLLLTAETAAGEYPVATVEMMRKIIQEVEYHGSGREIIPPSELSVSQTTCHAGCRAAHEIEAVYLVVLTESGFSAEQTARFRPDVPIVAFTPSPEVARRINMWWGIDPYLIKPRYSHEQLVRSVDRALTRHKLADKGDLVVILAGRRVGESGTTNMMEISRVGAPATWKKR
jgi:pyruvate kinase